MGTPGGDLSVFVPFGTTETSVFLNELVCCFCATKWETAKPLRFSFGLARPGAVHRNAQLESPCSGLGRGIFAFTFLKSFLFKQSDLFLICQPPHNKLGSWWKICTCMCVGQGFSSALGTVLCNGGPSWAL